MNTAIFLLAALPLGAVAAAWAITVAMRLRHPQAPSLVARIECPFCGGAGAVRDTVRRLAGGACHRCGARPTAWVLRAQLGGAAIPVLALYVAADAASAATFTLLGWLLLVIWITDELSLWIPHVLWMSGLVGSFIIVGYAGGAAAAAMRAIQVGLLISAIAIAASALRLRTRISPLGTGDYGVLAFIGAALGYDAVLDVLLMAGVLALGFMVIRAATPATRGRAAALSTCAALLTMIFGAAGGCAAAPILAVALWRGGARGRAAALPLGAYLAAATFILITWTAPQG
jgi:Flp pilus assembly protein protease CpaA